MPTPVEATGYLAAALVLLTFLMKDMRARRMVALPSNMPFSLMVLNTLPPVVALHLMLLPINLVRLKDACQRRKKLQTKALPSGTPTTQSLRVPSGIWSRR
jgi:hypothetical protein